MFLKKCQSFSSSPVLCNEDNSFSSSEACCNEDVVVNSVNTPLTKEECEVDSVSSVLTNEDSSVDAVLAKEDSSVNAGISNEDSASNSFCSKQCSEDKLSHISYGCNRNGATNFENDVEPIHNKVNTLIWLFVYANRKLLSLNGDAKQKQIAYMQGLLDQLNSNIEMIKSVFTTAIKEGGAND